MKTILVVCTGNICRSPMAVALLRDALTRRGLGGQIQVVSAGTWAQDGQPASRFAHSVMAERGLSLASHRAQRVSDPLLQGADLVLVMAEEHRRQLFQLSIRHLHKVFLLSEMSGSDLDVPDPMGSPMAEYEATAELLQHLIDAGLPRMLRQLRLTLPA